MCAGLAERRVRNDVEPFIANGIAALDTYSEDALLHPTKGGFYGRKLLLPGLSKFLQDLLVIAFDGTVIVVPVARLFEVMLDPFKTSLQLLPSLDKDRPVLLVAMLQILG